MNIVQEVRQEYLEQLQESKRNLNALIENFKRLDESKRTKDMARSIVRESIILERLTILEEAVSKDPHELAETMDGMLMSAGMLANRLGAEGLASKIESIQVPDVTALDRMSINKGALKAFMKQFADVGVMTKGLLALANEIGEQSGDFGEVFKTLQMAAKPFADGPLGQALFSYDQATSPMKKAGFGKGKAVSMQKKFSDAVMNVLKTKAPGAVKLLDPGSLVASMLKVPMSQIVRSFRAYDAGVKNYVDDEMLLSLTKGPGGIMGVLKGLADMFMSSGTPRYRV